MKINSLLIAAGLSSRMGKFKPLLLFNNKPIIVNIIDKLKDISEGIFIVTGFNEENLIAEVKKYTDKISGDKIVFVPNREFKKGMFTSLQAGLMRAGDCDWLLYHFVDQPHLPENFYTELILQINSKYDWIQPAFQKRKGHPVIIKNSLFKILIEAGANSNLIELTNSEKINKNIWECNYKEILMDIDSPYDYKELTKNRS